MKLLVRISPALMPGTHRRCGLQFTGDWTEYEVDEATTARLMSDQMLEVQRIDGGDHSEDTPEKVEERPARAGRTKAKAEV